MVAEILAIGVTGAFFCFFKNINFNDNTTIAGRASNNIHIISRYPKTVSRENVTKNTDQSVKESNDLPNSVTCFITLDEMPSILSDTAIMVKIIKE